MKIDYLKNYKSWESSLVRNDKFEKVRVNATSLNKLFNEHGHPDFLKIEGPFYKALGITNWKMLMVPNTDYTDSITTQANLRLNSDSFKTPIWSDLDITYNSRDFAIKHNAKAENEDFQLDLNVHPDTDITNSWKNLEFNI